MSFLLIIEIILDGELTGRGCSDKVIKVLIVKYYINKK